MSESGFKRRALHIDGKIVKALRGAQSTDSLGRKLCFETVHDTEVESRLDKACLNLFWMKAELCGRHVWLSLRLKLSAMVAPTFLYGSGTWTLTAERTRQIQTAQRRMLRWMLGVGRQ